VGLFGSSDGKYILFSVLYAERVIRSDLLDGGPNELKQEVRAETVFVSQLFIVISNFPHKRL
jgi:hypothetical protein